MPAARTRRAVRLNPRRAAGCSNHGIMKTTLPLPSPLPSLFLSHGSPMTALEPGAAGAFWSRLGPAIDATFGRPRAILAISAHSLTREPALLAAARHEAVYDFGGFPDALYQLRYDAAGAPALADEVQALLAARGIKAHRLADGGLDHGIWTPLRSIYPDAGVPVLPLAFVPTQAPAEQFALGQALAPLAAQGVLVVGSGSITHNLRLLGAFNQRVDVSSPEIAESAAFRGWLRERARARDWDALFDYRRLAPHAALMHPSDEHLLPWYVAAGVGGRDSVPLRLHDSITYGALAMDAYAFGAQASKLEAALAAPEAQPA